MIRSSLTQEPLIIAATSSEVVDRAGERPRASRPNQFVRPRSLRERVTGFTYYLKGRYVCAAFRHPRLFVEGLRNPDLGYLLQRAESLEFSSAAMRAMFQASVGKADREFTFEGRRYLYLYDEFNHAWATERTVEIPIALDLLRGVPPRRVLEVGNVLSHYVAASHPVIDKFELGPNVINQDVVDYTPPEPLDLILSVSTVEHIGWDEVPRDRGKISRTLRRFRSWLSPSGGAWITVPLGYNRWLDRMIATGDLGSDRAYFLRRVSFDNRWEQCAFDAAAGSKYGGPIDRVVHRPPYPRANAIGVFFFRPA